MRKLTKSLFWTVLVLALVVPGLIGCSTDTPKTQGSVQKSGAAELLSLAIDGTAYDIVVPTAISADEYDAYLDAYFEEETSWEGLDPACVGVIAFNDAADMIGVTPVIEVSPKATFTFSECDVEAEVPYYPFDLEDGAEFDLVKGQYFVIAVEAENGNTNLYRFQAVVLSNETALASGGFKIAGKAVTLVAANQNVVADSVTPANLTTLVKADLAAAEVVVLTKDPDAKVKYAVVKDGSDAAPVFGANNVLALGDGDVVYIEVTATNSSKMYYAAKVVLNATVTISGVKIAAIDATLGTPNALLASAVAGKVTLATSPVASAAVAFTKGNTDQVVEYALAVGGVLTDLVYKTTGNLDGLKSGDSVVFKVTAANGKAVSYYVIGATISDDATLDQSTITLDTEGNPVVYTAVNINGADVNNAGSLGTPIAVLPVAVAGNITVPFKFTELPATLTVKAVVNDAKAQKVEFATGAKTATTLTWTAGGAINATTKASSASLAKPAVLTDYLFVRITAAAGNTLTYALEMRYTKEVILMYGSPSIGANYIDPKWDALPEYDIDTRTNSTSENDSSYRALTDAQPKDTSKYTHGKAKLMWDETGVYVYVRVAKHNSARYASTNDTGSTAHQYDSVELFINERTQSDGTPYKGNNTTSDGATTSNYRNRGGQYRIAHPSSGSVPVRSGEPAPATTGFSNTANYPAATWAVTAGGLAPMDTRAGYVVTMKVPFRFAASPWIGTGNPETASPAAPWAVFNGKKIGIDMQINVGAPSSARIGCMVWQNITASNYLNCYNWGEGILSGKP